MHERSALLQQITTDPLWKNYPAVKNGRVHVIDWNSWVVYAPYSINIQLDEALSMLTNKAAFL
jgi:ABC-type Fe3+-hydroxamate transport system substrate-binding protein